MPEDKLTIDMIKKAIKKANGMKPPPSVRINGETYYIIHDPKKRTMDVLLDEYSERLDACFARQPKNDFLRWKD